MRFLTCEPPINQSATINYYQDEADEFYSNPNKWFDKNYEKLTQKNDYNYIVLFKNLYDELNVLKDENNFKMTFGIYLEKYELLNTFYYSFVIQSKRNHRDLIILFKSK
jgi:hypothetical protein